MGGVIYVEIMSFFLQFFLQLVLELHPQRDVFGEANGFADDRYFELRLMALHDAGITSFLRSLKVINISFFNFNFKFTKILIIKVFEFSNYLLLTCYLEL